jgi:hypothetical protein
VAAESNDEPLRLMIYDRTCRTEARIVGLSTAWSAGARLYRALGRLDAANGVSTWDEALAWLATHEAGRPISEIQFWGHGKWGCAFVDRQPFDASALRAGHPLRKPLDAVRERLVPGGEALFWFRTCETLGAARGLDFAPRLADHLGARVAGHTFVIGVLQSGLHGVHPGSLPDWSAHEGLAEGTPEAPVRALGSGPRKPRTISCFDGEIPEGWLSR